ncbi:septation protein A [Echinimonas agarilytica]|uniref:Inner membrane-spanning protein YciB n=1 Tax=Echinimonas agarilytica TaxID=1215918 RepID=A0AA42B846_9GAMM|nr:septation protein A [Echinimonas agarilytica]MCM2679916.1 septation protein A [Echinimonas agarilytica]
MKQLFDFLPLLAFFVGYKLHDVYVATGVLMAATVIQIVAAKLIWNKVEKIHVITLVMVLAFGSLTLFFQNDAFIKWKVTAIYGAMAVALLVGQWVFKKPLIKAMLGGELDLPHDVFVRLGYAWALFFLSCGLLNVYVAFSLSQETWVNFKVFGLTVLTILFAISQGFYIWRYLPKETEAEPIEHSKD